MKCIREGCEAPVRPAGRFGRPPLLCIGHHLEGKNRSKRCARCWLRRQEVVPATTTNLRGVHVCDACAFWLSLSKNEKARALYLVRKAAGICTHCEEPAIEGQTLCGECKAQQAMIQEAREQRQVAMRAKRAA